MNTITNTPKMVVDSSNAQNAAVLDETNALQFSVYALGSTQVGLAGSIKITVTKLSDKTKLLDAVISPNSDQSSSASVHLGSSTENVEIEIFASGYAADEILIECLGLDATHPNYPNSQFIKFKGSGHVKWVITLNNP